MLVLAPRMHIDHPTHLLHLERLPAPHPTSIVDYLGGEAWTSCSTKSLGGVEWGKFRFPSLPVGQRG
jgi:hypothetical protein